MLPYPTSGNESYCEHITTDNGAHEIEEVSYCSMLRIFLCISQSTVQVNEKSCRLRIGTYRDGVKRKGYKIGMGL